MVKLEQPRSAVVILDAGIPFARHPGTSRLHCASEYRRASVAARKARTARIYRVRVQRNCRRRHQRGHESVSSVSRTALVPARHRKRPGLVSATSRLGLADWHLTSATCNRADIETEPD